MSRPSRIYCKLIGCVEGNTAIVEIIGGPGISPESFSPHPCFRISADQIPPHKRFPNSILWFDMVGSGHIYVEPESEPHK